MNPKILIALDGTPASMRGVEHVCEVFRGRPDVEVTLYHVVSIPPDLLEKGSIEHDLSKQRENWRADCRKRVDREIFGPAVEALQRAGFSGRTAARVQLKEDRHHPNVAADIIHEVEHEHYTDVVLGRWGLPAFQEFLTGSVTCRVIHHLKNCAVWVVQ